MAAGSFSFSAKSRVFDLDAAKQHKDIQQSKIADVTTASY